MTFGERLREMRTSRNVSQRALADMVNIDFTYISKIEAGNMQPPSAVVIRHIAQALQTDERELLYLSGKAPSHLGAALKDNPLLTALVYQLAERRLPDGMYQAILNVVQAMSTPTEDARGTGAWSFADDVNGVRYTAYAKSEEQEFTSAGDAQKLLDRWGLKQ